MSIGHEMRRLRAEHDALATLSRIITELVDQPHPPPSAELCSVRGMLRDTLVRHLKCEDWVLYPRLKASGDVALIRMAAEFVAEMGDIASDFQAYDGKWTEEQVAADWPGFCHETRAVLGLLAVRIERENEELYPAVERVAVAQAALVDPAVRAGGTISS